MSFLKTVLKYLFASFFVLAGINHLVNAADYARIMPLYLPWHSELVFISGYFEIVLGLLLLWQTRLAAWGLIALLIAVFPANLYMALHPERFADFSLRILWLPRGESHPTPLVLWLRLPFQAVLIAWAFCYTRRSRYLNPNAGMSRMDYEQIIFTLGWKKDSDPNFRRWGAEDHKHVRSPVASRQEIDEMEKKLGFRLPEEYRRYLLEVGNGGVGPGYGLKPLPKPTGEFLARARKPFPLTESLFEYTDEGDEVDVSEKRQSQCENGTIELCHYGDGITAVLIIKGLARGTVWINDFSNNGGMVKFGNYSRCHNTLADEEDKVFTFAEWYEDWLQWYHTCTSNMRRR